MKITKDKTRILLTGSNGFLGSHVYDELLKRTYNKGIIFTPKRIDFDLTKESDVINMFNSYKPDIVMHGTEEISIRPANTNTIGDFGPNSSELFAKMVERMDEMIYLSRSQLGVNEKMLKYQQ
jgi:nucleoside-diphosphate-sugar epimerase